MLLSLLLSYLLVTQINGTSVFLIGGRTWIGEPLGNGSYVLMSINSSGATVGILTNGSLRVIYYMPSPTSSSLGAAFSVPLSPPHNESSAVYAFTNASAAFYLRLFTVSNVSNGELIGPARNVTYLGYPPLSVDLGNGINCSMVDISVSFPSPPSVLPLPVYVNSGPYVTKVTGTVTLIKTVPNVPVEVLGPDYVLIPLAPVSSAQYSVQVCYPINASLASVDDVMQSLRFSGEYSYSTTVPYNDPITGVPAYRVGWCSDYAVYAAHLLSEKGLDSRVAVGYVIQGGEATGLDYHAWLEAFIGETGWVDAEVTPPSLTVSSTAGVSRATDVLVGLIVSVPSLLALLVALMERSANKKQRE